MPYHPNIPDANDDPTESQGEILDNFAKMNTDFQVNHQPLTSSINSGFHTLVQFVTGLSADPNLAAPLSSLYTKLDGSNIAQLFFQNDTTANDVFQLTNLPVSNTGTNYSFITPWGFVVKLGLSNVLNVVFDATGPNFSAGSVIYTALVTGSGTTQNARITSLVAPYAGMTVAATGGTSIFYLVMGTP